MIKLSENNTQGKIASYLKTYKELNFSYGSLDDYVEWYENFKNNIDTPKTVIAIDIETKKLYCIGNKFLMFAITWKQDGIYHSVAFDVRNEDDKNIVNIIKSLNKLKCKKVLHNAYFDITTLAIMFGEKLKWDFDTYIIFHSCLTHRAKDIEDGGGFDSPEEKTGLSLKDLTRDFLNYGDYEEDLNEWKKKYCRENKVKVGDFTYDLIPEDILAPYNCMDTTCTLQLFEVSIKLIESLEKGGFIKLRSIIKLMHEVTNIYMKARIRGLCIDRNRIIEVSNELKEIMESCKIKIQEDLKEYIEIFKKETRFELMEEILMRDFENYVEGTPVKILKNGTQKFATKKVELRPKDIKDLNSDIELNLNSSKQKQKLFCNIMGLEPIEVTDKKSPKVDTKFFEHHSENGHPELKNIVEYLQSKKGINDFLGYEKYEHKDVENISNDEKTLWGLTSKSVNKVYPSYNLCGTRTFRTSTSTPNVAQAPSRGSISKIKSCYVAPKGFKMYYFDYCSMEVALSGAITDSKQIKEALENGYDLHSITAYAMFLDSMIKEKPEMREFIETHDKKDIYKYIKDNFEKTYRYRSKAVRFTMQYSGTEHALAKNLKCSKKEAKEIMDRYFKANPELTKYFEYCKNLAKTKGYTENYFGARQLLSRCLNYNPNIKKDYTAEKQLRKSTNFPIQSLNSFLAYSSMVRMENKIKEKMYEDKMWMVMSVYDSACYYVHESIPEKEVVQMLEDSFMCVFKGVDIKIDIEKGYDWYNMEKVESLRKGNMKGLTIYE